MLRPLRTCLLALAVLISTAIKAQYINGNIVVLQADASANNTTASIVELTTTGIGQTPVSSIGIDGGSASGLRFSGSATSTCYIANSSDGTLLCITGANTTATSGNTNAILTRGVGTLDVNQHYNLAATYTGISGNQARCATTLDDNTFWIADQGGFYTNNATSPNPTSNFRVVKSFDDTVYVGLTGGSAVQVSYIGSPSLGPVAGLNGLTSNGALQDFYLISDGSFGSTRDILYVVSATADNAGTISKYSRVGASWVSNGSYTTTFGGYSLAAKLVGSTVELYVSTGLGALTGNSVLKIVDQGAYNTAISINTPDIITLYTAPAAKIAKGVALAPIGIVTAAPPTVSLSVSTNKASESMQTVVTVTATASAPVTGDQTVALSVSGTGITTGDYTLSSPTITIPNGLTAGSSTFTIVDDNLTEGLEMASLSIGTPSSGLTLGSPVSQTITIQDNDASPIPIRITEYMYSGNNGEFVEFTNVGDTAVDMTGFSFDDDGDTPGAVSLTAFGIVQPGESVILTESDATAFRTAWNLCDGQPVIGGNTTNLSRADHINLYDSHGALVDRLTYDDQSFPGTFRTQNTSAYVTPAALGIDSVAGWRGSAVGDAEGSVTSAPVGGKSDIGSPGRSTRATVSFNVCAINPNAPTIKIDTTNTTNALDGGGAVSLITPYAVSSVIGDPNDPVSTSGIYFTIGDPHVAPSGLTLTVTSSNTTVVPASGLILTGSLASYNLQIKPTGVGYSNITLKVSNGTLTSTYTLLFAASQTTNTSLTWPTGIADASDAIALSNQYMAIADDEVNKIVVFNRAASGLPVMTFDYNQSNVLQLTDGNPGNYKELDVEAATPSPKSGLVYWFGSMSNSSTDFKAEPNRDRLFATNITGSVETGDLKFTNAGYAAVRSYLITWGDANGYDFTDAAAVGQDPKTIDGFNIEGAVFGPDSTTLYFGFRAPLVPTANRTMAVIAPLLNFESWYNNGNPTGAPTFGAPIELDLGGRGIRDMIRLSNGVYVIAAGMYNGAVNPGIYTWSGNPNDAPVAQPFPVTGLNIEGLMGVNVSGQLSLSQLQVITDNGSDVLYNDGIAAKDLTEANFMKFSSSISTSLDPISLPLVFESFTAQRETAGALLNWVTGTPGSLASFNVLRSTDGSHFSNIATVPDINSTTAYTYTDLNAPAARVYYRIQANERSGQPVLSTIRILEAGNGISSIQVYPNPVINGTFTLAIPGAELKTVSIYNSTGAIVAQTAFTETAKDFSTAGWAKGYYLIRIVQGDGSTATEKLIVQ